MMAMNLLWSLMRLHCRINAEAGASLVSTFTNLGIGKEDGERVVGKDWKRTELVKGKLSPLSLPSPYSPPLYQALSPKLFTKPLLGKAKDT